MKQVLKKGLNNKTGAIGEEITARDYINKGFTVSDVNYLKKWGEIDVVARGTDKVHFVEVKTVSYETRALLNWALSHETWRPEDNVHREKLKRLVRTINSWLLENNYTGHWQIDVAIVRIVPRDKFATIKVIDNVIVS